MGNTGSLKHGQDLPINYKENRSEEHPVLGKIRYITNTHDEKEYVLIEKVFVSEMDFQNSLKKVKNRSKLAKMKKKYLPNEFMLQILQVRSIQYSQICGRTFKIFLFIKTFDSDLKRIFEQRKQNNFHFTEIQILELILRVLNCLIELYDHNIKPYHLTMESILLRNNKYKLIDYEITTLMNPIDCLYYNSGVKKGIYIAPESMISINQDFNPRNTSKGDIFTLGMLTLQLSILKNLDQVYNYPSRKINFKEISSTIKGINYTQQFKDILMQMLSENPHQRIGLLRLKQCIKMCNTNFLQSSIKNNLQSSEYKPVSGDHKMLYLGKQPPYLSISNKQKQSKQRKNSFHRLLNNKVSQKSKKSISFTSQLSFNNFKNYKQQRRTSLTQRNLSEYQVKLNNHNDELEETYVNGMHDISENRSDKPISPITEHIKAQPFKNQKQNFGFIVQKSHNHQEKCQNADLLINALNKKSVQNKSPRQNVSSFNKPPNNHFYGLQHQQLQYKKLDNFPNQKNSDTKYSFQLWIQQQKRKLSQLQREEQLRTNLNKPLEYSNQKQIKISQLQTPRIKKQTKNQQNSNLKTNSFKRKQNYLFQQTPIKSLQMMQSSKQKQKNIISSTQKQNENIFGRYDFSNGAVYEGYFNHDNEFSGTFSSISGNGVLSFPDGRTFYSGCWKKNQFHGFGVLNNIQTQNPQISKKVHINYKDFNLNDNTLWTQYEGEFFQDKKHGFGTLCFVNGDKFSGCFVNDSIQGFGNFYQKDISKAIMGIWTNNVFKQA